MLSDILHKRTRPLLYFAGESGISVQIKAAITADGMGAAEVLAFSIDARRRSVKKTGNERRLIAGFDFLFAQSLLILLLIAFLPLFQPYKQGTHTYEGESHQRKQKLVWNGAVKGLWCSG